MKTAVTATILGLTVMLEAGQAQVQRPLAAEYLSTMQLVPHLTMSQYTAITTIDDGTDGYGTPIDLVRELMAVTHATETIEDDKTGLTRAQESITWSAVDIDASITVLFTDGMAQKKSYRGHLETAAQRFARIEHGIDIEFQAELKGQPDKKNPTGQDLIYFAGVPWGTARAEVTRRIVAAGFSAGTSDKDGDLPFRGTMPLLGEPAMLFAFLAADETLVKVQITIAPPDHRALAVYHSVKESLTTKYGRPEIEIEHYTYPYDDIGGAAGHETTAIRNGKGLIRSSWRDTVGTAIALVVSDKLLVELDYESTQWHADLERRRKLKSVF